MVKICVVGCLHGELDKMYEDVRKTELKYNFKTDIVLCCGDFQSIRNESDLTIMSSPAKYHRLGDFWKYYASDKPVPYLTVFVGGNHEASNYLQELPYGGWVAPNVYYLGYAGVVTFGGVRIAGLSGIYKRHDFHSGHFEHAPYDDQTKRTAYHTRHIDTFRLCQLRQPVDVVLSHDWPRGIYRYCGTDGLDRLVRQKPHFADEIAENAFGSPASEEVLVRVRPRYWFAAHHHCKFAAVVRFPQADRTSVTAETEVTERGTQEDNNRVTRFLALDKCLPSKHYMQFIDIAPGNIADSHKMYLSLDPEWLCVLRATNHLMSISKAASILPTVGSGATGDGDNERSDFSATEDDLRELGDLFNHQFKIPDNFEITAPVHTEEYEDVSQLPKPVCIYANPQTDLMCAMLELINPNAEFLGTSCSLSELSKKLQQKKEETEDEDDDGSSGEEGEDDDDGSSCDGRHNDDNDDEAPIILAPPVQATEKAGNPEEIDLGDDEDDDNGDDNGNVVDGDGNSATVVVDNTGKGEQYDPADYSADDGDSGDDENGYCPMAPSV